MIEYFKIFYTNTSAEYYVVYPDNSYKYWGEGPRLEGAEWNWGMDTLWSSKLLVNSRTFRDPVPVSRLELLLMGIPKVAEDC